MMLTRLQGNLTRSVNPALKANLSFLSSRSSAARFFSDSHDDFSPKRKVVEGQDEAHKLIDVSFLTSLKSFVG